MEDAANEKKYAFFYLVNFALATDINEFRKIDVIGYVCIKWETQNGPPAPSATDAKNLATLKLTVQTEPHA